MTPYFKPSENGYSLYGFEPPNLKGQPAAVHKLFWSWVVDFGLKEKDRDLARGLDKDGKPLRPIREKTRKYRRSAMTPSGKGDPKAPPLTPGWQKSRTRSLLDGKAFPDHAEFWWRYDPYTRDSWAKILEIQAEHGRDVFGLSPQAMKRVQRAVLAKWADYQAGRVKPQEEREAAPIHPIRAGRTLTRHAVGMGEITGTSGWMTSAERRAYFSQTATAEPPGRTKRPVAKSPIAGPNYNRLIQDIFPPKGKRLTPKPPKPGIIQRIREWLAGPTKEDVKRWFRQ